MNWLKRLLTNTLQKEMDKQDWYSSAMKSAIEQNDRERIVYLRG